MRRRLPPLNALAAFEAVVRLGSVSRAAAAMGVAQPAVSRHVRALEDRLGVALVERGPNRLRPTEAGRALADAAGAGFDRIEAAAARLREEAAATVRLGCSMGVAHHWLLPRLPSLRRAAPDVTDRKSVV